MLTENRCNSIIRLADFRYCKKWTCCWVLTVSVWRVHETSAISLTI